MLLKIGPFDIWSEAVAFLNLWTDKTRGKSRRLERGLELFAMYGHTHNLCLWGQSETQEEILEKEAQQPPRKRAKKRLVSRSEKPKKQKVLTSNVAVAAAQQQQQQQQEWTMTDIQNLFNSNDKIEKLRLMHEAVEKRASRKVMPK